MNTPVQTRASQKHENEKTLCSLGDDKVTGVSVEYGEDICENCVRAYVCMYADKSSLFCQSYDSVCVCVCGESSFR